MFFEITLRTTGISWIDALMLKYNLGFFIITICFLILINGSNFIDGVNGNLAIHYFFLIFFIFFVNLENSYLNIFIYPTLISLAIFLIFNLKKQNFLWRWRRLFIRTNIRDFDYRNAEHKYQNISIFLSYFDLLHRFRGIDFICKKIRKRY